MDNTSSVNTILIVIVLVLIVGFGVWWYKTYAGMAPADDNSSGSLQINVDTGGENPPNGDSSSPQNY